MAIPLIAAGAVSLIPSVAKWFAGRAQSRRASQLNPVNPGFVQNQGIIDNANMLQDRYRNYVMPGYGAARDQIGQSGATAFSRGSAAATSSGDLQDLAVRTGQMETNALGNLAVQSAAGRDQALNQYLEANALAGNEPVRQNMWELQEYQRQLQEKAALEQAGATNQYGAGTEFSSALSTGINSLFSQPLVQSPNGTFTYGESAWDRWKKKRAGQ